MIEEGQARVLLSGVRFLGRIRIYQASCLLLFTTPPWPPVSSYPRNLLVLLIRQKREQVAKISKTVH